MEHKIYQTKPEGWKILRGAINHPPGMRWIWNGKSRFGGEYEKALVPEEEYYKKIREET